MAALAAVPEMRRGPPSAGDHAGGRGAGPDGRDAGVPCHRPMGAAAHPHPTPALGLLSLPDHSAVGRALPRNLAAHADRGRPRRTEHGGGHLSGAGAPEHGAPGVGREDPAPFGLRHGGPAAPRGRGAASALALGGPGRWGEKDNEIPGAQRVLATLPLEDTLVTADALPAQTTTAPLIGDRGGESRLTVKANPPRLHPWLAHSRPGDFSPSTDGDREGPRPDRHPHDSGGAGLARDRVPVRSAGSPAHAGDGAAPPPD